MTEIKWQMPKAKGNQVNKTVTFDIRSETEIALLKWADTKPLPMNFTQIVHYALLTLREKLEAEGQSTDPASFTLDMPAIERAAERGVTRALARLELTPHSSPQPQPEPIIDTELESNLANLF